MKKYYKFFILLIFTLFILFSPNLKVYASRGCCSYHGGISHCGSNGYYICNDGTKSPICACNFSNNNSLYFTSNSDYSYCKQEINTLESLNEELKKEINYLEKQNEELNSKVDNLTSWIVILIIACVIIYFNLKQKKSNN